MLHQSYDWGSQSLSIILNQLESYQNLMKIISWLVEKNAVPFIEPIRYIDIVRMMVSLRSTVDVNCFSSATVIGYSAE